MNRSSTAEFAGASLGALIRARYRRLAQASNRYRDPGAYVAMIGIDRPMRGTEQTGPMWLQHADPMRWLSFIPAKLPLQVVGPARGPGDAMLKFIGEALKSETANRYPVHAMSSPFVPKRKRKAMR